jgi:hypothetical protein
LRHDSFARFAARSLTKRIFSASLQIAVAARVAKIQYSQRNMNSLWQNAAVIAHTQILARSLKHWTGRDLLPGGAPTSDPARSVGVQASACSGGTLKRELQRAEPKTGVPSAEFAEKIFHAPFVLVSHGTEADPVLNYGNAAALSLWEMSWEELTRTPSRLTAEAPNREERAKLLATVTRRGFIDDYSGIRISKTGRRFKISRATVWNLLSDDNQPCGQAAMFSAWEFL